MKETILAVTSIGIVQGVAELPINEILKTIVSIIVGATYIVDMIYKRKIRKRENSTYKHKGKS